MSIVAVCSATMGIASLWGFEMSMSWSCYQLLAVAARKGDRSWELRELRQGAMGPNEAILAEVPPEPPRLETWGPGSIGGHWIPSTAASDRLASRSVR